MKIREISKELNEIVRHMDLMTGQVMEWIGIYFEREAVGKVTARYKNNSVPENAIKTLKHELYAWAQALVGVMGTPAIAQLHFDRVIEHVIFKHNKSFPAGRKISLKESNKKIVKEMVADAMNCRYDRKKESAPLTLGQLFAEESESVS